MTRVRHLELIERDRLALLARLEAEEGEGYSAVTVVLRVSPRFSCTSWGAWKKDAA